MTNPLNSTDHKTSSDLVSALYLVATPIGNLADMTHRAIHILKSVDLVLVEDTRVTAKLFKHYGIKTKMRPYHDHSSDHDRQDIIKRLGNGHSIALVSDAGTPLVSDPGYKLVRTVIDADNTIIPIPGANAATAALSIAGLPPEPYMFIGFLPPKSKARQTTLDQFATVPSTLITYESPNRLAACLQDMQTVLGDRPAAVARELTKLYEDCRRGTLSELARYYEAHPTKGEIVILIGPPAAQTFSDAQIDALLNQELKTASPSAAAATVAKLTGKPKRDIYARALQLKP